MSALSHLHCAMTQPAYCTCTNSLLPFVRFTSMLTAIGTSTSG
jgi:hypothetical protein